MPKTPAESRLSPVTLRFICENPWRFIACGFGVGASPWMPGTLGTLLGVAFYWGLSACPLWVYITLTVLAIVGGIPLCEAVNRDLGTDDHPAAVWDEIATFPLVMLALPRSLVWVLAGFVLFRFFDILKPGPIGWLDRQVHGGLGVMLDDVAAALVSWALLFLFHQVFI